jgi:hypothetical protein
MMQEDQKIWGVQKLVAGAVALHRIGPLTIWLERSEDEWHYAFSRKEMDLGHKGAEKPENIEWNRWVCGHGDLDLELTPAMPPRPVVVRPVMPVQILPGQRVDFFISIPIYVSGVIFDRAKGKRVTAFEEPTVVLSNSWYGLPSNGTLCYALRTRARRTLDALRMDPHLAVCPIELVNESAKPLLFERILLRTSLLGLYAGRLHVWTSPARLLYRGEDPLPELIYHNEPPQYDGAGDCLSVPRELIKTGMFDRAMGGIRGIGKVFNG